MSESQFLKYQDKNNDGLVDVCDTTEIQRVPNCPACIPNPNAVTPDWKKRTIHEPWFNEKYCIMQCTVETSEGSLIPDESSGLTPEEYVEQLFDQYRNAALVSLLDNNGKLSTDETIQQLVPFVEYTKYDLEPRENSVVKLLYSVPVDEFALIEDAVLPDEEEDEQDTSPISVTYQTADVFEKLMKFRKGMYLFSRYYRVYTGLEGGLFYFDDGSVYTHSKFDKYGDPGFFVGSSRMADVLKDLDNFLNDRGYNLYLGNPFSDFKYMFSYNNVVKFTMEFSSEYKLEKLKVYTVGCREKALVINKEKLEALNSKASFKDPTAMAYFTKLSDIETYLGARVAQPWTEFVTKFTYPKVSTAKDYPGPENDNSNPNALSCVGDALLEEGKQLGQDIVDDIFSIGDAIAYQFHKNTCKKSLGQVNTELEQMGLVYKTDPKTGKQKIDYGKIKDPKTGESKKITQMALSQAFEELEDSDQVFVQMCAALLGMSIPLGATSQDITRTLWRDGLGRVKLCGLLDLMTDAIQCMFKGLDLNQALEAALQSALRALPIENWGDLFIGLPPSKQAELDALVKKNLYEMNQKKDEKVDRLDRSDDDIKFFAGYKIKKPWEDKELVERLAQTKKYGNYDNEVRQNSLSDPDAQKNQRTIAQKFDKAVGDASEGSNFGLSPDVVMEAYIMALLQTYSNDLLALVDVLNKFPGAQIIAKVIAVFDCPAPPTFDPSFMDFIKSIDLPFCRNINEIQLPMLQNPFGWIPEWADIMQKLYELLVQIIQMILLRILFRILVKLCELLGDAICRALQLGGDIITSLPDLVSGRDNIFNVINESICGGTADPEQVDATIAEMFEKFGVGGAALSNTERIKEFCEALSSACSRREVLEATTGNPSQDFLNAGNTILVNQFPDLAPSFPGKADLGDLFTNVGNLMPAPVRGAIRDFLNNLPEDDMMPANPSLCATPEDIANFKDRRCALLEGRATPEQCAAMFDGLQNELLENMEELTQMMENGIGNTIADALPPLVSQPGCDDGIVPFETEDDIALANALNKGTLEQLQIDYSKDMLGNGGLFAGDSDWGFMNMILSDTHGRALSTHRRRVAGFKDYVDYVTENNLDDVDVDEQEGQFPAYVAEWLWQSMSGLNTTFNSDNSSANIRDTKKFYRSFDDLGYTGMFGTLDVDLISLPDFGYNTVFTTDMSRDRVEIIKAARKKNPDLELEFYDNNAYNKSKDKDYDYNFGFSVKVFFSDIEKVIIPAFETDPDTGFVFEKEGEEIFANRTDDNVRVSIVHKTIATSGETDNSVSDRRYEFLSVDDTLTDIDLANYTNFSKVGTTLATHIPQVEMLKDLTGVGGLSLKGYHDQTMSLIMKAIMEDVAGETDEYGGPLKNSWRYGAEYDDLTEEDLLYVVKNGQTESPGGTEYSDAEVTDYDDEGNPDGTRDIENDDMILGISQMQYNFEQGTSDKENRVFYLDPKIYGGSYARPSMYIKPVQNKGWLGMVDVMFPEIGPCKPQYTDLVDFKSILDEISQTLATLPEDQRLKMDKDCVSEKPYNRILNRESKAGIQGLIRAACRIYGSVHFLKSLATFTTFNTAIRENYSSLYASYIVEIMEKDFKDAQGGFWEFFNSFKDDEFWYSFLEQAVQTYGRLADNGEIEPTPSVQAAIDRLNQAQENYKYPSRDDLKKAKDTDRAQKLQTLKSWRLEQNYEAVQATEEDAKLILKEFVRMELEYIAEKFNNNLKIVGIEPEYNDLMLYMLNRFTQGAENLDMDKEIVEEASGLPKEGGDHYTNGSELSLPDGTPYVGYYHVHVNEDGNRDYMVGEQHTEASHEILTVYANKISIPIGDIAEYPSDYEADTADISDPSKPFSIRKYISINGVRKNPTDAVAEIKTNSSALNISQVYPGTLDFVTESNGNITGLSGELGVRYGLVFYANISGSPVEIASAEVDALDLRCTEMAPLEANSKLLYCLVNNLKDDEKFKIFTQYVFPISKLTAITAIYNDQGFMPSIAQVTADKGADSYSDKPGMKAVIDDETGEVLTYSYTPGWEHVKDRTKGLFWTWGYRTWDEWDYVLLRNSKSRIKRLFKGYYNSRDWDKVNSAYDVNGGEIFIKNLKAALSFPAGAGLLSWWQRGRLLKGTPFNADGKLCTKKD